MAVYANISIDQGSDFTSNVTVEGSDGITFNLTGYTVRGQIRKTYTSSTSIAFVASIDVPSNGRITITLPAATTAAMKPGRYVYDLEIVETLTGKITRVVEGQVEVNPRVTRTP
jgi:hypothetical protein